MTYSVTLMLSCGRVLRNPVIKNVEVLALLALCTSSLLLCLQKTPIPQIHNFSPLASPSWPNFFSCSEPTFWVVLILLCAVYWFILFLLIFYSIVLNGGKIYFCHLISITMVYPNFPTKISVSKSRLSRISFSLLNHVYFLFLQTNAITSGKATIIKNASCLFPPPVKTTIYLRVLLPCRWHPSSAQRRLPTDSHPTGFAYSCYQPGLMGI